MQCIHINLRQALLILLSFLSHNIHTADNQDTSLGIDGIPKTNITDENSNKQIKKSIDLSGSACPSSTDCNKLPVHCIHCTLNTNCIYGEELITICQSKDKVTCQGNKEFEKSYLCRYCYQTEHWEHKCLAKFTCGSNESPRNTYITNCTTNDDVLCLGNREFIKKQTCNWTAGYKWSTALFLSITVGGFGADRFYLGHWQEGIGKLFSFGGLGVWTIVDVILISLHYLGPADGSLYL